MYSEIRRRRTVSNNSALHGEMNGLVKGRAKNRRINNFGYGGFSILLFPIFTSVGATLFLMYWDAAVSTMHLIRSSFLPSTHSLSHSSDLKLLLWFFFLLISRQFFCFTFPCWCFLSCCCCRLIFILIPSIFRARKSYVVCSLLCFSGVRLTLHTQHER